jgi:phosphatidylserine decarboxylase
MKKSRIHREGRNAIILITLLIFVINVPIYLFVQPHWVFAITLILTALLLVFVTYFFRNPVRVLEVDDPNFIIAPADGRVVVVEPMDENEYFHERRLQVSIFMSPFNVHANWYPIEGTVLVSEHQKGRHKGAWLPKSSTENERSLVVIETPSKVRIALRQVAGAMARRIVTYAKAGQPARRNHHLGFIKLGSRVDMYLPLDTEMFVAVGEAVRGNETIIGRLAD